MEKELQGLKELEADKHLNLLRATTKKNTKLPTHDGIHRFWFKKFISIYDRLAL